MSTTATGARIFLGQGVLEIPIAERAMGRWGSVMLNTPGSNCADFPEAPEGRWGVLRAIVQKGPTKRHAWHEGDQIALGNGYLFVTHWGGFPAIGLRPVGDRQTDWLNKDIVMGLRQVPVALVFDPAQPARPVPMEPEDTKAGETANRLDEHLAEWHDRLAPREVQALVTISLALRRIAEEDAR